MQSHRRMLLRVSRRWFQVFPKAWLLLTWLQNVMTVGEAHERKGRPVCARHDTESEAVSNSLFWRMRHWTLRAVLLERTSYKWQERRGRNDFPGIYPPPCCPIIEPQPESVSCTRVSEHQRVWRKHTSRKRRKSSVLVQRNSKRQRVPYRQYWCIVLYCLASSKQSIIPETQQCSRAEVNNHSASQP